MVELAFRVLVEAAHQDLADAVTVHPVCQEEPYNPGLDVSINPNENSILTLQRPVPDVRLGYAPTGQSKITWAERAVVSTAQAWPSSLSIVSLLENRTWTEDRIQRTPAIAGAQLQLWVT